MIQEALNSDDTECCESKDIIFYLMSDQFEIENKKEEVHGLFQLEEAEELERDNRKTLQKKLKEKKSKSKKDKQEKVEGTMKRKIINQISEVFEQNLDVRKELE